jgi:hypothetical protein
VADHRAASSARLDRAGPLYGRAEPRPVTASPLNSVLVLTGLATGGFFAAASLVTSAAVIRLLFGSATGTPALLALASCTVAGACAGSHWARPAVTRLVLRNLKRG